MGKIMIQSTINYSMFELLPFNRDVEKTKFLRLSMEKHGYIHAYPIHVVSNGKGKLRIKAGHHRFVVAKDLGLPIYYVISNDTATIHELEKATNSWKLRDYLVSFARCNKEPYVAVERYHRTTGIGLNASLSMLAGEGAGSGNKMIPFKDGTYQLGDPTNAGIVADIVLHMKKCKIPFATNNYLVIAISRFAFVPEFSPSVLKRKISTFPFLMERQPTVAAYSRMLDTLYNRQSKVKIPIAFLADEAAKKRNVVLRPLFEKGSTRKKAGSR